MYRKLPRIKERTPNQQQPNRRPRSKRAPLRKQRGVRKLIDALHPPTTWNGAELKYDRIVLSASCPNVAVNADIGALVTQGDTVNDRTGGVITVHSVNINGMLVGGQSNVVTDDNRNIVRLCLTYCDGGAAAYFAPSVDSVLAPTVQAGLRKVLYDHVFDLQTPGADSTGYLPATRRINVDIPVNMKLFYTGAAGNTINGGTIIMSIVSDSAAVPNPGFANGYCTFFFTDY